MTSSDDRVGTDHASTGRAAGGRLGANRYGKSGIRLLRVTRQSDRSEVTTDLTDLTVDVSLEGDFEAAHVAGDNRDVLPTDTMRGTVYAFAGEQPVGPAEAFGARLARHFLTTVPAARRAQVSLAAEPWSRVETGGRPHPHAFLRTGPARRTATVTATRTGDGDGAEARVEVAAGVRGLTLLKTTGSAFAGFLIDRYTTLEETSDRILATSLDAVWRYGCAEVDWDAAAETATRALVTTFAGHDDSRSLQHTLYAMGTAVLGACPEVTEVGLTAPNKHHMLADLSAYGQANDGTVFVPTEVPHGLIEATVTRE